ncbi:hypothetical protein D3C72_373750 [compost metagenome]
MEIAELNVMSPLNFSCIARRNGSPRSSISGCNTEVNITGWPSMTGQPCLKVSVCAFSKSASWPT